jgi:anti-anti-sigma regulatory factor
MGDDRYELPAELNIYSVLESRDALLAWVTAHPAKAPASMLVSAVKVSEVDGSGLQLLAALTAAGHHWRLLDASPAFELACRTLGFAQWLEGMQAHDQSAAKPDTKAQAKTKAKAKTKSPKESAL